MLTSTRNRSGTVLAILLCAGAALQLATPAHAEDTTGPDVTVAYADLRIDEMADASRLLKRIEAAAARVCDRLDHGSLASRANVDKCEVQVTEAAVKKINHPTLLAVYDSARRATQPVAGLIK